jgi:uncharacterized protein (DUF342 family)
MTATEQDLEEKKREMIKRLDEAAEYIRDVPEKHDVFSGGTIYTERAEEYIRKAKINVDRYFNHQKEGLKEYQRWEKRKRVVEA